MEAEALAVHKIDLVTSQAAGMPIDLMLKNFRQELDQCDVYIAHSLNFDRRIMAAAGHRGGMEDLGDRLKEVQNYCTMMNSTKLCAIPQKGRGGLKWPTLVEALDCFNLDPIENVHRAMDDARGCVRLFRYLWSIGAVTADEFVVKS